MDFSSIISGIGDFVDNNSSWLKPVAQAGLDLYKQYQKQSANDKISDIYRQREQNNYNNYLAEVEAYNQQVQQQQAAANAARASAQAARAATEKNRQAAASKANDVVQKNYKQMIKLMKPYQKATSALIVPSQENMEGGFDIMSKLNSILSGSENMALLKNSGPAYAIDIPLPDYLLKKKEEEK